MDASTLAGAATEGNVTPATARNVAVLSADMRESVERGLLGGLARQLHDGGNGVEMPPSPMRSPWSGGTAWR